MSVPQAALDAVLNQAKSAKPTHKDGEVKGFDLSSSPFVDYSAILDSFATTGLQAMSLSQAFEEVNKMLDWDLSKEPVAADEDEEYLSEESRQKVKCTIFLAHTSNMISSGMREYIRYLVQHKMVQAICTSAGGIEEDFIKCLAPTRLGDYELDGRELRAQGLNRIGNMIMPNDNYCLFEEWFTPILEKMHDEQEKDKINWTPSKIINRLGKEINDERSVYYWAYKNDIPVFCPALTDGSLGDMLYFHSWTRGGFVVDIVEDIRRLNDLALKARKSGVIVLGGGTPKHHVMNANLMRNGADYCVYIGTGQEFDGSDSGAKPDEAVSWGKVKVWSRPVKVYSDATLVFPFLVAKCFATREKSGQWAARGEVEYAKQLTASERELERKKTMGV